MWIVVVDRRAVPREPGPASSRFYAISQTLIMSKHKRATGASRYGPYRTLYAGRCTLGLAGRLAAMRNRLSDSIPAARGPLMLVHAVFSASAALADG